MNTLSCSLSLPITVLKWKLYLLSFPLVWGQTIIFYYIVLLWAGYLDVYHVLSLNTFSSENYCWFLTSNPTVCLFSHLLSTGILPLFSTFFFFLFLFLVFGWYFILRHSLAILCHIYQAFSLVYTQYPSPDLFPKSANLFQCSHFMQNLLNLGIEIFLQVLPFLFYNVVRFCLLSLFFCSPLSITIKIIYCLVMKQITEDFIWDLLHIWMPSL